MKIIKDVSIGNGKITLLVRAVPTDSEARLIAQFKLRNYKINTKDGTFLGKHVVRANMASAFRTQVGKVKNRWSASLLRTTGSIFVDAICTAAHLLYKAVKSVARLFFGTRRTLGDAIKGIKITSSRPERIREAEFFILISLATVQKSLDYIASETVAKIYDGKQLFEELEGLDFAGMGAGADDELQDLKTLAKVLEEA